MALDPDRYYPADEDRPDFEMPDPEPDEYHPDYDRLMEEPFGPDTLEEKRGER